MNKKAQLTVVALAPSSALLILALLAAAPVWGPGLLNTRAGGDSPFLLWRVQEMAVNLRAGVFPVRWMPDAAYGYGYPFFNYYAALPFYLAGLLNVIGMDILTAIKLTQTIGFIAAAFAMYGWSRHHFSTAGAWLASVAYTFAAFHLVNVYTRGDSLSEFYAFIFYPLSLWALDAVFERRDARSVVALAVAFGGLFITHNLSAFIFSLFVLPLYIAVRAIHSLGSFRALRSSLIACAVGLGLGLALSAWVWAPFTFEKDYAQLSEQTTGYFNYSNHFRGADLVQPTYAFDYKVGQTTPFSMSSVQATLAVLGLGVILGRTVRRRKLDALSAFTLAGLFVSTAMITPLSRPLWDHLPYLPLVQFPWRFLSVQAVFTALATAQVAGRKMPEAGSKTRYAAIAFGLLLAITTLANLHPTRLYISPADVTTERLQLYEMFTANIGTTIRYEWLPRGVVPRLYTSDALVEPDQPMRAAALEGEAAAARISAAPTRQAWRVTVNSSSATVAFPVLWWPGWQATVDTKPVSIHPANSSGRIVLDVPGGDHAVVLSLERTPLRAAAESMSLVALLVVGAVLVFPMLKHRTEREGNQSPPDPLDDESSRYEAAPDKSGSKASRALLALLIALILLAALAILISHSTFLATANDETMDFSSQPYLHHNPDGAELSPGLRLLSYHLSADELQAGQTLDVSLDWLNASETQTATVKLVSPAQHLVGLQDAPTRAESFASIAGDKSETRHALAVPSDTPRGVYLIELQSGSGEMYLRPVRVVGERPVGEAPILAQFGDRIRLHGVRTEQVTPTQFAVTLDWSTTRSVEANYAIAVRLHVATGGTVASIDTQPGYGFLPTSLWHPGELISDRYTLSLPEGTPPRNDYQIEVILYDAATLAGIGQYVQPNVPLTLYARRPIDAPVLAHLGPEIALATLDVPPTHQQGAPMLTIKPGWLATSPQSANRVAQWTILDSQGTPVFTQTTDLVAGAPSAAWPAGAFVAGETQLNVPASLEPGKYHLSVTLLDAMTQSKEGTYISPTEFEIVGHPRSFTAPPISHRADVEFGQQIKLLGYDLASLTGKSAQRQAALTLYWQAMVPPQGDYKEFVHLFNPADEKIAVQHDAMPLDNRYPTSWWAAGEVVSETVTLDLKDVPAGTYRLAVGLYDPRTVTRLAAVGQNGTRLDADRVVLPDSITTPK